MLWSHWRSISHVLTLEQICDVALCFHTLGNPQLSNSASLSLPVCRRCRSAPLKLDRSIQPRAQRTFPTSLTCDLCKFKQNFSKWELCESEAQDLYQKNDFFFSFFFFTSVMHFCTCHSSPY